MGYDGGEEEEMDKEKGDETPGEAGGGVGGGKSHSFPTLSWGQWNVIHEGV